MSSNFFVHTAHTSFSCGCCLAVVAAPLLRLLWVCALSLRMFPRAIVRSIWSSPTFYEEISHFFVTWAAERVSPPEKHRLLQQTLHFKLLQNTHFHPLALGTNQHPHRAHHTPTTSVSHGRHLPPKRVLLGVCASAAALLSAVLYCD